ncbi:Ig-like domain-containing protein, partial [Patescibacteria group bacterium]|nr:Ig-like domain-containing protein [Patescibacteria group bacterium]
MILKNFYQKKIMFFICLLLGLFLYSNSALAQATYNALVTIPGIRSGAGVQVYLSGLYTFLISVVGVVAMGAIVIGGARYLTSAGNPSVIEDAKHTIYSAIIGLLLAITSWVIIWEINPDVTVLKNPAMPWEAVGYSPTGPTPQCALATGSPTSGCACVDNPAVPVLGITDPMPPYVASVSSSCAAGVSSASPYAITIIFSELMDPASVATFTAYTFNPAVILASYDVDNTGNASIVNINFAAGGLAANTDYTVTIKKTATRLSGVGTMLADYVFKFTTNATFAAACVPPITGTGCNRVCSDKSLASDGLYHCIKADLRVGNSYNPIGKTVTVKS